MEMKTSSLILLITTWIVILVLSNIVFYKIGVFAEKIGALEDVVFLQEIKNVQRE